MSDVQKMASEISQLMPVIARRILFEFFHSVAITQTQIFTIVTLSEKAPCRLSELSRRLNVAAPTVTGIVDRLEKSGYVKRIPDPEDRRAIQVDLTPKGIQVARQLRSTLEQKWKEILEKLPKEDQEHYLRIIRKIRNLL